MGTGRLDGSGSGEMTTAWTRVTAVVGFETEDTRSIVKILRWEE